MSLIDSLNRQLEDLDTQIENNSEGDAHYLQELMSQREKVEDRINTIIFRDF